MFFNIILDIRLHTTLPLRLKTSAGLYLLMRIKCTYSRQ